MGVLFRSINTKSELAASIENQIGRSDKPVLCWSRQKMYSAINCDDDISNYESIYVFKILFYEFIVFKQDWNFSTVLHQYLASFLWD